MKTRIGVAAATATLLAAGLTASIKPASADPPPPLTETSAANEVASIIQEAGEATYSATFAGVEPTDAASVTIYTAGSASSLMTYANGVATSNSVTLTQTTLSRSWSDLQAVTESIAADDDALRADNINILMFGPEIANNTVVVTLGPSPAPHPSNPVYVAHAQADLDTLLGSGKAVVSSTVSTTLAFHLDDARDNDVSPYTGGDAIYLEGSVAYCTDSWEISDNATSTAGVLTAGHCGPGPVDEATHLNRRIGTTWRQHWLGSDHTDFEEIKGENYNDSIWKSGANTYLQSEDGNPAYHSLVSTNGDFSGEHMSLRVEKIGQCVHVPTYLVCGIDLVDNSGTACQEGDSGGPVYHRLDATHARVSGIIESDNGTTSGSYCAFEAIRQLKTKGNFSVVIG